jgi:ribosome maturation factor RimP
MSVQEFPTNSTVVVSSERHDCLRIEVRVSVLIIRPSLKDGWADFSSPFFLGERLLSDGLSWSVRDLISGMGASGSQDAIERTVTGLGFDLVEVERSARGLLRVSIDRIPGRTYPEAQGSGEYVTVDDCEVVTRQLQYVLEVEQIDYERLEVASPGLDRPLKKPSDFVRFAGADIDLALKQAFQGRKHWKGQLAPGVQPDQWCLRLPDTPGKAGQGTETSSELVFTLDEVREARLVPVIDFKRGRGSKPQAR